MTDKQQKIEYNNYDYSLIGKTVMVNDLEEVGNIAGFKADKVQVVYDRGWVEVPMEEIKFVKRVVQYIDIKTKEVLLEKEG